MPEMVNEQAWLEGFISEAATQGLDKTAATELLKTAVRRDMVEHNPAFAEGYRQEMEKQGINWLPLLAALGIGGGVALGGQEFAKNFLAPWGRNPDEQAQYHLLRQGSRLFGGPPVGNTIDSLFRLRGQSLRNQIGQHGGKYIDPTEMGMYGPYGW